MGTELNVSARFDLGAKYAFCRYAALTDVQWHVNLYKAHIHCFNGGYEDPDHRGRPSTKRNVDDFVREFRNLIASLQQDGYKGEAVPIDAHGVLENGSHRFTACRCLGICCPTEIVTQRSFHFDYRWFGARSRFSTLSPQQMNTIGWHLAKMVGTYSCIVVYPSALRQGEAKIHQLDELVRRERRVVYDTHVTFASPAALFVLIRQLYYGEDWIAGPMGGVGKRDACRAPGDEQRVRLYITADNGSTNVALKEQIRAIFQLGKHSVHMNDTQEEASRIAAFLLNANSVAYANRIRQDRRVVAPVCHTMLATYRAALPPARDDFYCIDSSFVMGLYGLRAPRDLDYLRATSEPPLPAINNVQCHNEEECPYGLAINDIVTNPQHHMYFAGVKCITLEVLRAMKQRRNEKPKDVNDVVLIDSVLH